MADIVLNLKTGNAMDRKLSWDAIINRYSPSRDDLPDFTVKIIYPNDDPNDAPTIWALRSDLYVGYQNNNGGFTYPAHKDTLKFNLCKPYTIDDDQALSAGVIISEAARFDPVRSKIEELVKKSVENCYETIMYSDLKPLVTKWKQLVEWKKSEGNLSAYTQVLTAEDIRTFASTGKEPGPYGADRDYVLEFIKQYR